MNRMARDIEMRSLWQKLGVNFLFMRTVDQFAQINNRPLRREPILLSEIARRRRKRTAIAMNLHEPKSINPQFAKSIDFPAHFARFPYRKRIYLFNTFSLAGAGENVATQAQSDSSKANQSIGGEKVETLIDSRLSEITLVPPLKNTAKDARSWPESVHIWFLIMKMRHKSFRLRFLFN